MREFVGMPLRMVCPDVLDFVTLPASLRILLVARRLAGVCFDIVGEPREHPVNLAAVHAVETEAVVESERFCVVVETLVEKSGQLRYGLSTDLLHYQKHRVLHGRVVDGAPVPYATVDKDVDIGGCDAEFAQSGRFVIFDSQECKQHRILQGEVVLCVVVQTLKHRGKRLSGSAQSLVPVPIDSKVPFDEPRELRAWFEAKH